MKRLFVFLMATLVLLTGCSNNFKKRTTIDQEKIPYIVTVNGNWRYNEEESVPENGVYLYTSMKGIFVMTYMSFDDPDYESLKGLDNSDWDDIMTFFLPALGVKNAEQKEDYHDLSNKYVIKRYYGDYTYNGATVEIALSATLFKDGVMFCICSPDITKSIYANEDTATIARGDFEFEERE